MTTQQIQQKLRRAKADYAKATKELGKWENIMLDSIEGTCVFTPEQVKKRMDSVQKNADDLLNEIETFQAQLNESKNTVMEIEEQHQNLLSWAELYDGSTQDEKTIIASHIIKAVTLSRNYDIQIDFNISEAQYLSGMEMS